MRFDDRVFRGFQGSVLRGAAAGAVLVVAAAGPAAAVGKPKADDTPRPPTVMSAEGGALLARPGEQVGPGAPALPDKLSALSFLVSDLNTGQVLAAKNAHWRLPPASTLKTLFADTVLPKFSADEQHKVADADLAGMGAGSSLVGIVPGQTYKVADLWRGVFLRSGNDAVHVLAAMNGGVANTVSEMQAEARSLGANDTHVVTPDGYDEKGQVSSAYDLSLFARQGLTNADFARYCDTARAQFPGKGKATFEIDNTDRLLSGVDGVTPYPGIIGVKNGYTTNAGNTLVVAARRGGHAVLVTVMNPQSGELNAVYNESRELLDWGFKAIGHTVAIGTLNQATPAGTDDAARSKGAMKAPSSAPAAPAAVGAGLNAAGAGHDGGGNAVLWAGLGAALVLASGVGGPGSVAAGTGGAQARKR